MHSSFPLSLFFFFKFNFKEKVFYDVTLKTTFFLKINFFYYKGRRRG
jgi:hypothetical protein